ncbi:hypothetical protein [Massilia genomosp. 1]|uniref:Uncharacterized protein n=1 Tax=Massilia genomosp. 1 TaxID=2609280 RepID=A0ABX0MVQ9_9BURK|nr:hypothetical protein [Massilia genomosp. 1]NHZ64558.1 hypothetical protein [Massilia genomosp. 1]
MTAKGDAKVKLAKCASFEMAAKPFEDRWGEGVRGKKDARELSRTLVTIGFNTAKSSNGGTDNYASILENIIRMVKVRMQCR